MDFFDVINNRRSIRRYTETKVPDEVIQKALDAALRAPNSSNMQAREFYWVKSNEKKLALVDACLFQGTARQASHLIVVVSRIDTWKRNREILIQQMQKDAPITAPVKDYYYKIIPFLYTQDPFGILGVLKYLILNTVGLFRPIFRTPAFRSDLFEVVTKSAALACENFMLAISAQGFGSCPMEGFDERRVKKILKLNNHSHVVMVISVGETAADGIFGPQYRIDPKLVVHEV